MSSSIQISRRLRRTITAVLVPIAGGVLSAGVVAESTPVSDTLEEVVVKGATASL